MSALVQEFTIDRSKWRRGDGGGVLLDDGGCGCVLGHLLAACGVAREPLSQSEVPSDPKVRRLLSGDLEELLLRRHSDPDSSSVSVSGRTLFSCAALAENDLGGDEGRREARLIDLFRRAGITLRFVGEGRPS